MTRDLQPSASVGIKLASLAVHADELLSPGGDTHFDGEAIKGILADAEVQAYIETLRPFALLPVKRGSDE